MTTDVDGCTGSGSLHLNALSSIKQSVPGQPNRTYYFGYRFKASGGPSSAGSAHCYVSFLPAGNTCNIGEGSGGNSVMADYNNDNWISGSGTATSGSDTTTVLFACSTPAGVGYHDQLYLSTSSPGVPAF
jgi:hypothetical protein